MTCGSKRFNKKGSQNFGWFFWLEIVGFCWLELIDKNPTLFVDSGFCSKIVLAIGIGFTSSYVNKDESSIEMTSNVSARSGGCIWPLAIFFG